VLALIDFGFSTTTANPALAPFTATSVYGTVVAIPPEGLLMRAYHSVLDEDDFEQTAANKTVAGDMWAIGTILINIYVPIYWNFLDLWSPAVNAFATRIIQNEGLYLDTNRQAQPGIMDLLVWIGWYGFLYYLNESQFPTEPNYNDITDESEILRTRPCKYMAELNQLVIDHAIGYELYSKLFGKWTNPNFIVLLRALCQWYPENRSSQQLSEIMEYDVFSTIKHTPIDSRICVECRQQPATLREERNAKYAYCSNNCAHQSYI
jgi:serine/threonine protein kinase